MKYSVRDCISRSECDNLEIALEEAKTKLKNKFASSVLITKEENKNE